MKGKSVALHPERLRWDGPFASAEFDSGVYRAELDGATLDLDFTAGRRRTRLG